MAFEYPRLSNPDGLGDDGSIFFQCVIIGSGFGGAVMAARLSEHFAPGELVIFERGKEFQPGDFPTNFAQAAAEIRSPMQPFGMYDFTLGADMDSLVGNALGGTSNLYANVLLEPYPEVFNTCMDPQNPSGSRCWPQEINYEVLRPYFSRVRGVMGAEKYLDSADLSNGITVNDPHLEGSPLYGAELGVDPQTGRTLRDYRGRAVAERPPLAKAEFLKNALEAIQDVHDGRSSHEFAANDPLAGAQNPNGHLTGPDDPEGEFVQQEWTQLRNGLFQDHFATRGDFSKAPIAVNLTLVEDGEMNAAGVPQWKCRLCGDCVTGCNIGAKNTLIMNYLPLAKRNGVMIYTQVEVTAIGPADHEEYRYRLEVLCREEYQGKIHSREVVVYTNMLILSAGAFGTAKLLLQAQMRNDFAFSPLLGKRFSGNADAIAVSYNGKQRLNSIGYGLEDTDWDVGPTITAMADFRRVPGRRHLVEDAAFPSSLVHSSGRLFGGPNLWKGSRRIWIDVFKQELTDKVEGALNYSQVWLAMGHDSAGGELRLNRDGGLQLGWSGAGGQQVYDATRRTFAKLAHFIGGSNIVNPRTQSNIFTRNKSTPITVHPLGGCCMADDIDHGVVDHAGRVFHPDGGVYPGLYISDGSVCDSSVGANPSLTIAALAERSADEIIANDLAILRDPALLSLHEIPCQRNASSIAAEGGNVTDPGDGRRAHPMPRLAGVLLLLVVAIVLMRAVFDSPSQNVLASAIPGSALSESGATSPVVPDMQLSMLDVRAIKLNAPGQMRVGILAPEAPIADIIFIHGHADRLDNHGALFQQWRDAGFRVIAFDLPSHGESNILPIDLYTHEELAGLARMVDQASVEAMDRPLFLAAWSFGGLVATRITQEPTWRAGFTRDIAALLLLTPAVTPYPFAGGDGISRIETLTNNPNAVLAGPPSPAAPAQNPIFAGRLLYEAWRAHNATLPSDLPVMVLAADPEQDWYVNEEGVIAWAKAQQKAGADLQLLQCPQAKHALDNEPYPIGPAVWQLTTSFFDQVLIDGVVEAAELDLKFPEGATCRFVE